jgi:photosystem II stability/assembly factor-like uncharacterized protein
MLRIIIIIVLSIFSCIGINVHAHNPHEPVRGLGISPNFLNDKTLFLATDGELTTWRYEGILRSTDGGATWTKLPRGMDNYSGFSVIRVSPHYSNDQTVFAATLGNGIYQSSNRGNSWQSINSGLSNLYIKGQLEIAKTGSTGYVLFLNSGSGALHRRFNTETSWTLLLKPASGVNLVAISPDFMHDTTVMTLSINGNLRISTDAGNSWIDKGNPTSATTYSMAIAPGNAREIFLATNTGIFYSNDSGNTFTNKSGNLPIEAVNNIVISPNYLIDKTLFCTTVTQAVFKSTDGGGTWIFHDAGARISGQTDPLEEFSELQTSTMFATDQTIFLSSFGGLRISTDGGSNWIGSKTRENLITGLAFSPHFIADQSIIATTYNGGGFYTSIDKGVNWAENSTGWFNPYNVPFSAFDIDFVQNHTGSPLAFAVLNQVQVGFSSDFGENWSVSILPQFPDIAPGDVYINIFAMSPAFDSDHEIYLGTRGHGVLQTADGGTSWRSVPDVPHTTHITSVAVSPNYANDKIAFAANRFGEVWRTQNGGDNWSRVGSGSIKKRGNESYVWIAISPAFATDRLVLVGTNNGIYRSGDNGNTWMPLLNGTIGAATVIQQIEFSPNFVEDRLVYVTVRGKGLYRFTFNNKGWIALSQNAGAGLIKKNIQFTEFRISPSFKEDHTLLGASRESFYISIDGGFTWVKSGSPGQ